METLTLDAAVGAVGTARQTVTHEITVAHFHPDMPAVFATPFMVWLMEVASADALRPFLPSGSISVGVALDVRHLAATPIGLTVTATARVLAVAGRQVTFEVSAHDGVEEIGEGRHVRAVVDPQRLEPRLAAKRAGVGAS